MIKTLTCYAAACDVCDATPESDYGYGVDHYDNDADALEKAREDEWWATETVVLCNARGIEHAAKAADIADILARTDTEGEAISDFRSWCESAGHEIDDEPEVEAIFGPIEPGQGKSMAATLAGDSTAVAK